MTNLPVKCMHMRYHLKTGEYYLTLYRHISGFRLAYRPEEPQEWEDHFFYRFALALPNRNPGALMPGISSNEEDWMEDENGCIW